MDISNQMICSQVFNNSLFKRFNYPLNIESSKDVTLLGKAKIIFGPHIYSNTNFYKFNKNVLGTSSNFNSQNHPIKREYGSNKSEASDDFEIIFEIVENKKYYFIFPKKSIAESLTISEPYEIIISIESANSNNNDNNQDDNLLLISGASELLRDTLDIYFENNIHNQDFSNINKLNIPNKNLVLFNFQSNEFQFKDKNDEFYKYEMSMPELQDNSQVLKSIESNISGNNNSNSNNNNNTTNSNSNSVSMINKIPKKKLGQEKTGMDSKHILGKISKNSKNIMKIPSKYPPNKNLHGKAKNSTGLGSGSGSTTISNETTVMTSGQVGSLSSHYQNASSPLYSLSHSSGGSNANQGSGNSGNNSGGTTRCCSYCGAKSTPIWRRGPEGTGTLCNACGVKWKNGKILTNDPPTNTKMNSNKHGSMGNYGSDSLQHSKIK